MKHEVLDAVQRLSRNIKRSKSSPFTPDTHGRSQGKTLRIIEENDGIRANALAVLLDIRPSSLTQKLDRLELDGNIERRRDRRDARVVKIHITDQGREVLRLRNEERQQIGQDFSDCLTKEEKEVFCTLCSRLSNNLEAMQVEEKAKYAGVALLKRDVPEPEQDRSDEEDQIG